MFRITYPLMTGIALFASVIAVWSQVSALASTRVTDVVWNSSGQWIASVDTSGTVIVVDSTQQTIFESAGNGIGTSIAWDPTTPERLAIATRTQGMTLFNVISGDAEAHYETDAVTYSVSISPDGSSILTSHGTPGDGPLARGYISVVEISTGNDRLMYEGIQQRVTIANWSSDGNQIAGLNVGDAGEVVIWDANSGEIIQRLSEAEHVNDNDLGTYITGSVSNFKWSPGGNMLAMGTELEISFWETITYNHIATSDHVFVIEDMDWRPNEPILAVANGSNRQIQLVHAVSGEIVGVIPTSFDVFAVSWSPDGTQLAFADGLEVVIVSAPSLEMPAPTPTPPPDSVQNRIQSAAAGFDGSESQCSSQ